ncbi:MAG: tRNA (adenosine(37)-N6)-threonylcarbamoyltransferase complex dimerization subunit type 1 TsaB, partial [Burkholderiales bacterium]|nr:tRNA (adenosine(37)-N6)-threonylcarbamoyltransferase complex dimerization subunit type 1 TsaB [Burkholderiales bacterium]
IHAVTLQGHRSHSSDSLSQVHQLMLVAGVAPSDCVAVAADVGPGGFTGLRTACGLAQGLAVGWGVPCITKTSLELLAFEQAQRLHSTQSASGLYFSALDARQNEVYVALHELRGNQWFCLQVPQLRAYGSRLNEALESWGVVNGPSFYQAPLQAACGAGISHLLLDIEPTFAQAQAVPGAQALVELAAFDAHHKNWLLPAQCQPLYVRDQVALTTEQRKAKLHV